jgi:hypothetical protein
MAVSVSNSITAGSGDSERRERDGNGGNRRRCGAAGPVCVDRDVRLHGMSGDASVVRRGVRRGLLHAPGIPYATQCTWRSAGKNRPNQAFSGAEGGRDFGRFYATREDFTLRKSSPWRRESRIRAGPRNLSLFWPRDRPGARSVPGRSRGEILLLRFRRSCTRSVNSSPVYARFNGLYYPATTIALPRPDSRPGRRRAGQPQLLNSNSGPSPLCASARNGRRQIPRGSPPECTAPSHAAAPTEPRPAVSSVTH